MDRTSVLAGLVVLAFGLPVRGQDPRFTDHRIATVPDGVEPEKEIVFARDGTQVAYAAKKDGKLVPIVGQSVGEAFDYVDPPEFGPHGEQVAFRVGRRISKERETWWVFAGGKKTGECDWIGALSWSPDGSKLAYWTQPGARMDRDGIYTGGSMVLVVGNRKSEKWDDADALTPPAWSRDSKVVASIARKGEEWFVLIGDKTPAKGPFLEDVTLADDGKSFAYSSAREFEGDLGYGNVAPPATMQWLVYGPKRTFGKEFDSAASPVLSPDGKSVAFKATKSGKVGIAVDDEKAALPWDFVTRAVWSPSGKVVAFAGVKGCEVDPSCVVSALGDWNVKGGTWQLVVDGNPTGETCDEIRGLAFSADSKRVACRARTGASWRIVCGEVKSEPFDLVGEPQFSPDGKQLAFGARSGRELVWKTLALP